MTTRPPGLTKTWLNIPITGIKEAVASELAEPSPGLSVCENLQFAQKISPTFRPGFREVSLVQDRPGLVCKSVSFLKGHCGIITDKFVESLTFGEDSEGDLAATLTDATQASVGDVTVPYTVNDRDQNQGLHRCSPEKVLSITARPANNLSGSDYFSLSTSSNYTANDVYYYSDAPNTEEGLAVVMVWVTYSQNMTSDNKFSPIVLYLVDVATGAVLGMTSIATVDGTSLYPSNVRLMGCRDSVYVVQAGNSTTGSSVNIYRLTFSTKGFLTGPTNIQSYSDFLPVATNSSRGLLTVDYDRRQIAGGNGNMWFAYHCVYGLGASGNDRVILGKVEGSSVVCKGSTASTGAPASGKVASIGLCAYAAEDQEVLLVISDEGGSSTRLIRYRNSGGVPSLFNTTTVDDSAWWNHCSNSIIYINHHCVNTTLDKVDQGTYTSYGICLSTTSSSASTQVSFAQLGNASAATALCTAGESTVPKKFVMPATVLGAVPFTRDESGQAYTMLPVASMVNDSTLDYPDPALKVLAIRPPMPNTEAGQFPPESPCPPVVSSMATGVFCPVVDRSHAAWASQRIAGSCVDSEGRRTLVMAPISDSASLIRMPFAAAVSALFAPPQSHTLYKVDHSLKYLSSCRGEWGTVFACGSPFDLDAGKVVESSMHRAPYMTISSSAGSSGIGADAVYRGMLEYETTSGHVIWGTLCSPLPGPNAAKTSNTLAIYNCFQRGVRPGQTISCHIFRRESTVDADYYVGTVFFNDRAKFVSGAAVTFLDNVASSDILKGPRPYYDPANVGNGSPLPRQGSSSLRYLTIHKDRIFGVDEDGRVRFTGPYVTGEHPWWSDLLTLAVPGGGFPTGLLSTEGRLLVFKPEAVFAIDGDGPPDNGGNGTEFSLPQKLSDIGCVDGRSILATPYGTFFRSSRGFEIIRGGGQATFIGLDAQKTTAKYPYTIAAAYDPMTDCAKFLLATDEEPVNGFTAGTKGGAILCYYIKSDAWVTHRVPVESTDEGGSCFSDMTVMDTPLGFATVLASADGRVFIEERIFTDSAEPYVDPDGGPVTVQLETQDIRLGGATNSRFALYGAEVGFLAGNDYDTSISLAYDYSEVSSKEGTVSESSTGGRLVFIKASASRLNLYAVRVGVRFSRYATAENDPDATFNYRAPKPLQLAIEVGIQRGLPKLPAGNKV